MEKFKACEKEMKTKAFSKEGLTQSAKLDPKQQEKADTMSWVQSMMDELMVQAETAEAEIETLQGGAKKKHRGGSSAERLDTLEHLNERRKWHISRLELILRLLDNGTVPVESAKALKEDVTYFVDTNSVSPHDNNALRSFLRVHQEEDFDEDEGIYDELNLDEAEEKYGLGNDEESEDSEDASEGTFSSLRARRMSIFTVVLTLPRADLPPRTPSKKQHHDDESVASSKRDSSPVMKKAVPSTIQLRSEYFLFVVQGTG